MNAVELTAPAKLTLSLRITGVRPDGYHLLEAEMVTIDLADRLVVEPGDGLVVVDAGAGIIADSEGSPGAADVPTGGDNLVARALDLAGRRARVTLHKSIPAGAGLGGGSADAAAILRWAGFDDERRAAQLGADVAFCLRGGRARVTGIGEIIEPLPFERRAFTLCTPPFACSTAAVYRAWDELGGPAGVAGNDLEAAALALEPGLGGFRDALAEATGQRPRLAGSGSTWFVEGAYPGPGRRVAQTTPSLQVA
ncbi:MAG: 4-(cytidine 5'-diphospho)-2-C-methyl-D-erythritol kinase [Acidimicrobiia bacterium]|nr:4-(cytidine 5'-diphospho)-2-C-methyl-D-erythritol kinase [Acidimicrobiia bacterium]MYC44443.1 4-(cytidine 5'-diphospho)-2-C-methyl-D-erythritol kinase [Acidimicrobiia bacterium]